MSEGVPITVTTRIRHSLLVEGRKRFGYSQKMLGEITGVPSNTITRFEQFNFSGRNDIACAEQLADALGLTVDEIIPPELAGDAIVATVTMQGTADPQAMKAFAATHQSRHYLPSPADVAEQKDEIVKLLEMMQQHLSYRERAILKAHTGLQSDGSIGDSQGLLEIGKQFNITRERVRQVELRATRKLKEAYMRKDTADWPENPE